MKEINNQKSCMGCPLISCECIEACQVKPVAIPTHELIELTAMPKISLRDYFAGQALMGIAFNASNTVEEAAFSAYNYADAMLKAREQQ